MFNFKVKHNVSETGDTFALLVVKDGKETVTYNAAFCPKDWIYPAHFSVETFTGNAREESRTIEFPEGYAYQAHSLI